jgi:hypothetical protein
MLVMRKEQIAVLARPTMERFEQRAVKHVEKYFPDQVRSLGAQPALEGVRRCLERALAWGLSTERELLGFVTLAFVFGRDFDTDPALPWASRVLGDDEAETRMTRLQAHALAHRAQARGYFVAVGG